MNTRYLDYILAVNQYGSISKAAEKLFLSQPTLSQHIQKLEKELGTEIFDRSTSPIKLTYAGERFIHYATEILSLEQKLQEEITDIKESCIGRLTLGISSSHGNSLLPYLLPKYHQSFPNIKVIPIERNATTLEDLLLEGKVDCIISNLPLKNSHLEYDILCLDQVLLVVPENLLPSEFTLSENEKTTYFRKEKVDLETFKNLPFLLLQKGHRVRQIADNLFTENKILPKIALESINIQMLYKLALIGM